jgi:hypothetical protein
LFHPLIERNRLSTGDMLDSRKTLFTNRGKNGGAGFDQRLRGAPRDLLLSLLFVGDRLEPEGFPIAAPIFAVI